jgi:hypothetical protein
MNVALATTFLLPVETFVKSKLLMAGLDPATQ